MANHPRSALLGCDVARPEGRPRHIVFTYRKAVAALAANLAASVLATARTAAYTAAGADSVVKAAGSAAVGKMCLR